jgi:hypothetical protein
VQFLIPSGKFETQTLYDYDYVISSNPTDIVVPDESGEIVTGTCNAVPVITIENLGEFDGTLIIENLQSGELMTWYGVFVADTFLRFDTERKHVERSIDDGVTWTSAVVGLSGTSLPIELVYGVSNTLRITGLASANVNITYRGRFF